MPITTVVFDVGETLVDETHVLQDKNLEDDLTNINSTKINPPV